MFQIEIVKTIENFDELEKDWQYLLTQSSVNNLFLSFPWVRHWWNVYQSNHDLMIILVRQEDRLIGIAPLYREKNRVFKVLPITQICFIGDKHVAPCFLDFIISKGYEKDVLSLVIEYLVKEVYWDRIFLDEIDESSPHIQFIKEIFYKHKLLSIFRKRFTCPYQKLPNTIEQFLREPDTTFKKIAFRRHVKRLMQDQEAEFISSISSDEINSCLGQMIQLQEERWHPEGKKTFFDFHGVVEFLEKIIADQYNRGNLSLFLLRVKGSVLAIECGFIYDNNYYSYILASGFEGRKLRAGTVLSYKIFEVLVGQINEFHYLRGNESFKYKWGCKDRWTLRIEVWKGIKGKAVGLLRALRYSTVRISP